ncbi:hypothetical protein F5148DRAFT_1215836 [Russula earlei]|uniref:Uncharacterized protein n=1 Tax=Russula earlei TaxID=71964 RepID=A0ACC0U4K6_9AGAM|nr:hypothetical protein F5148DRAFT_1215836 [Russula earlei]
MSTLQCDKNTSDLTSQLAASRAELVNLQERYHALRADRDRLAHTLEENMKKWKRFKRWMFAEKVNVPSKEKHDKDPGITHGEGSTPASQQLSMVKMLETPMTLIKPRSTRARVRSSPAKSEGLQRSPLSLNRHILNTPRKIRISSEGSPSTRQLRRTRDENVTTVIGEMSQTQEDSQALTFWQPSTPSQREHVRNLSLSSSPPAPQSPHVPHSPLPTKRPRLSAEPVLESASSPFHTVSRYKRARGSDSPVLNAKYEIDPAMNAGVPFAFDEVVRGRRHRRGLNAGECEECSGWYAAVGPLPPRLEAPHWSSPSRPSSHIVVASDPECHRDAGGRTGARKETDTGSYAAAESAHRQAVSRHRAQWERAPTPPGYWDIWFPDTQAVEKINEQAAEIHRRKRAAVAREAKEANGRYHRRA